MISPRLDARDLFQNAFNRTALSRAAALVEQDWNIGGGRSRKLVLSLVVPLC